MAQELISVIVPIYNIMDCLPRCVQSICGQTYRNLEILLVDDGSNDGTERLVDELAAKDKRIRVFHKANGGSSSARNLGISMATGKYLAFVDSDDYIEPQMYEKLMECILEKNVPMAQISRDEIDENGNRLPNVCEPPKEAYICGAEQFMRELLLHRGDCSYCTKLTHRALFMNHRFPEGELNEDFRLLVEMLVEMQMEDGEAENDKPENDKPENGKTENDRTENDKLENDKPENGKTENDKLENNKSENDKTENDRIENNKSKKKKVTPGIAILPEQYYHVFYRTGSNTRKKSRKDFSRVFMDIVNNADMAERIVEESYPALKREAVRFGLYQRLDYMLHIPVENMAGDNIFYQSVKKYLRKHLIDTVSNPFLTGKNKIYLLLLTAAPRTVRRMHGWKMKMRHRCTCIMFSI